MVLNWSSPNKCTCPASQSLSLDLNVKHVFLILLTRRSSFLTIFGAGWKNDILLLLCGLTGGGNHATHSLRRMLFLSVRENFRFKYASCSLKVLYIETGWSRNPNPLMRYTPWVLFLAELVAKYGWVRVSYFQNWDLQLLCSAFVVTGSILPNKPFRIYALRFLLSKLVASSAWLVWRLLALTSNLVTRQHCGLSWFKLVCVTACPLVLGNLIGIWFWFEFLDEWGAACCDAPARLLFAKQKKPRYGLARWWSHWTLAFLASMFGFCWVQCQCD